MIKFEQWWENYKQYCPIMTQEEMAKDAWDTATRQVENRYAMWNDVYATNKIHSLEYQLECANDMIKMLEKELLS